MNIGIDLGGMLDLQRLIARVPDLAERNLELAMVDSAVQGREILHEATVGPKSGKSSRTVREVAENWRMVRQPKGADIINSSEIAAYLEYGVGIFNEGPGHKGPIVPRRGKFLRWIGPDGKPVFRRSVKGFKGVAMVRNSLTKLRELAAENAAEAVIATLEGRPYA